MATQIEIVTRTDGKFDWSLRHLNGDIVATSGGQGYESRSECVEMARKVVGGGYGEAVEAIVDREHEV